MNHSDYRTVCGNTLSFLLFLTLLLPDTLPASGHFTGPGSEMADPDSLALEKVDEDLPLDPERLVRIHTDEGTWISLDISPDGSTLVFDLLGNLYTLPAAGGEATPLTRGMAFDTRPRFSPDGESILFTSDRSGSENLWIIDSESGETRQVTHDSNQNYPSAEWTPDGEYIVAARGRIQVKLWLFHKEGGSGVQITEGADNWKTVEPAVSPDGRFIYYSHRSGGWSYNAQLPQYQIGVYDRETARTSTLTSRYGSAFSPVLSPDGKWLVYGSRYETETGLVLRDLETGDEKWLAWPVQRDEQESIATMGVLPGMTFTPDSQALLASWGGKIWQISVEGGAALNIPFEAEVELQMGPRLQFSYPVDDDRAMTASQIRDAVPSPDGSRLAFTALNRLYVMDLPDGEPSRVTQMDALEAMPAWSPDGRSIAFVTWEEGGGHLYSINLSARNPQPARLTNTPALYSEPAWSYNSDRIALLRNPARVMEQAVGPNPFRSEEELVWISANGGDLHLVDKAAGRGSPHFVKRNDRIYLNHGSRGLISLRWDGTDEREHIRITGITTFGMMEYGSEGDHELLTDPSSSLLPDPARMAEPQTPSSPALIRMAPEGDQALALINNDVYVVTVPWVGEAPTLSVANPDGAAFPAKKLTEIGGQFPSWGNNGRRVHWSIGNAHFIYDLDDAAAFADSVEAAQKLEEEAEESENGDPESENGENDNGDPEDESEEETVVYQPDEFRVEVPLVRDIPEGTVLLKHARIITMAGDEIIERGDLLIDGNRIRAVGESGTLEAPPGTDEFDLEGKTVIPGFIDTHAHLRPAWGIHRQDVWAYAANLAYGVTTTRDPQTGTTDVLSYSDQVETGAIPGPRIYSTGPGLGFWAYNIRDLDHAKNVMRQYSEYYDTKTIKMYMAGNREQRQWILMAANEQKIMPTTEGALNWKLNLTQLIDGYPGHEHSFPVYPIYRDIVTAVSESKMAYTPTLLVAYGGPWAEEWFYANENPYFDPKLRRFTPYTELASKTRRRGAWFLDEEHIFARHAEFVKELVEAGGIAGVGSHGQLQGLGFHWELWAMHSGGASSHDALRMATILGAEAIGLEKDLGSLEAGKLADLIILDSNPLEDIRNTHAIRYVMKNGRLYEGDTLDEQWPDVRPSGINWWTDGPAEEVPGMQRQEPGGRR